MKLDGAFAGLADPRTGPAQRHDLREMILMALCAVLCGADNWVDVAEWAEDNDSGLSRERALDFTVSIAAQAAPTGQVKFQTECNTTLRNLIFKFALQAILGVNLVRIVKLQIQRNRHFHQRLYLRTV